MSSPNTSLPKESHFRSITKGITWRILASITTMTIAFLVTGKIEAAAVIGGFELVAKFGLYYGHERIWQSIPLNGINKSKANEG